MDTRFVLQPIDSKCLDPRLTHFNICAVISCTPLTVLSPLVTQPVISRGCSPIWARFCSTLLIKKEVFFPPLPLLLVYNINKVNFYLHSQKSFFIWEDSVCVDMLLIPEEKKKKRWKNFYNRYIIAWNEWTNKYIQFLLCKSIGSPTSVRPQDGQLLLTVLVTAAVRLVGQTPVLGFGPHFHTSALCSEGMDNSLYTSSQTHFQT